MTDQYMKELMRIAVAQICQTIGYNATQTAPLELLQDVLDKFLREFTRDLRRQVEHYNRTEANLNDVTLTLDSINVNLNELLDYINNVEPVPFALEVPKFPARKDSYLNFLKPGSKEVLTRPVHVHDHLPPMLPPEITQPPEIPATSTSNSITDMKPYQDMSTTGISTSNQNTGDNNNGNDLTVHKAINPAGGLDKTTLQSLFKPSSNLEDGERPTREVSSVVMTTGGYISPAVEGKMPEAIVPDIIDKLLGLDAPPPPAPPPPPPPPVQSRPASRSANSTPIPPANDAAQATTSMKDAQPDKDIPPSTSKESKKALAKMLDASVVNKKSEMIKDISHKKEKVFKSSNKMYPLEPSQNMQPGGGNYSKKSFMMHQNAAGMHTSQTNYANMLLKKAKKQKVPLIPGQPLGEKHGKPVGEKMGKLDANDKAQRKYMKMLQKMAKQGKIPPEVLSNIMGPDKKSKMINPSIVANMPPGPEKLQLEKLLRKQAKQRQKMMKQQMMSEVQKQSKKLIQPPPLVPIFPLGPIEGISHKPLHVDLDEQKLKIESKDIIHVSPAKASFTPNIITPPGGSQLPESLMLKNIKTPVISDAPPIEIMETPKMVTGIDGKELKLSNEPDRTKLNIFKKISKQKTPKSSSPTPMRIPGLGDTPIINLPSGTTITPAPGPSTASLITSTPVGRNLFPPLPETGTAANNVINLDDIKDKPATGVTSNPSQPTDLSMFNRVFGEKPNDVELINKPKKRGRKPGSKNSPKIPGAFPPNNLLKKSNKKLKMDNALFGPQMQIPPELAAAAAAVTGGNLTFDNMAQLFSNHINPLEWAHQKQLQQQMMIATAAKDRKETKKKNKLLKQDLLSNDNHMASMNMKNPSSLAVPTNEEVQSINKKLMRMDTILKPAPSSSNQSNNLSIDTSLITGKKLPSPSMFPSSASPLKSPGNSKRLLAGVDAIAANLVQPFMLPHRPAFPNLPTNMLSMLQFPFPTRPGLIPTPGLFPTPGLGAFPNNPKNPLLPGLFPFPNLKQPTPDNLINNQESEDLTTDKKKSDANLQNTERSYCNVAPLVPEFLTKLNESSNKHMNEYHHSEPDLPKTPKPRSSSHSNTMSQDNLLKKIADAHTPESASGGSISGKSIPSTPGGMSLNAFEQLMKKNDSPLDLMSSNKQSKIISASQESGLDFSMNKKQNHPTQPLGIKSAPITLNNEPIEVSDDSDETNQQQPPPPPIKIQQNLPPPPVTILPTQLPVQSQQHLNSFNMDEVFVANTTTPNPIQKPIDTDLSTKELKKLKKQVKKSSSNITTNLINTDNKSEGGVGKLAGGADLIPLASTGLAYSAKNIPFNSLTANANPSFNAHKSDFNPPAPTPTTSSVFDNLTITAAIPSSSVSSSSAFDLQKKRKEHKKIKKLKEIKEGKIKKKKDKKDKTKSKEKAEKYLLTQTSPVKEKETPIAIEPVPSIVAQSVDSSSVVGGAAGSLVVEKVKDKVNLLKKLKKEKKKEKQRSNLEDLHPQNVTMPSSSFSATKELIIPSSTSSITAESETKKQKTSPSLNSTSSGNEKESVATTSTLPTAAAPIPAVVPKLTLKLSSTHSPTPPLDDSNKIVNTITPVVTAATIASTPPRDHQREPSPELARISPLVTRPPKHKLNTSGELATSSSTTTTSISAANASTLEIGDSSKTSSSSTNPNMIVPPPSPWLSGGTISASSVLLPHQLLQSTKQHDMTTTPISATHNTDPQKTTNTDRQSPLTLITETSRPSSYIDAEGNRVWICPACGKVDDGSPMIGCDGCDAWYHWVCVGIFVAPKDNEDWFCRVCITRKKGLHGSDKKRKRNKKK